MMDGQETVLPSAGRSRGLYGQAHPLRVCTRLVEVWPYGPGWGGRGRGVAWRGVTRGVCEDDDGRSGDRPSQWGSCI